MDCLIKQVKKDNKMYTNFYSPSIRVEIELNIMVIIDQNNKEYPKRLVKLSTPLGNCRDLQEEDLIRNCGAMFILDNNTGEVLLAQYTRLE